MGAPEITPLLDTGDIKVLSADVKVRKLKNEDM